MVPADNHAGWFTSVPLSLGRATDGYGRIKGYAKLFVLFVNDASPLPGYLGCDPFMSITALAERNTEGILQGRR